MRRPKTAPPLWWLPSSEATRNTRNSCSIKDANPIVGPGFTPLHWAAAKFDHQLSDYSNGISSDNTEWSSFGGLRGPERLEFVKALIAHGANVNARMGKSLSIGISVKTYMCNSDTR